MHGRLSSFILNRKYIVLIAFVLVGIMGIFAGCSGDAGPYAKMRITASTSSVTLNLEIGENGMPTGGKTSQDVTISVSNVPEAVSRTVSAMSLDTSIAAVTAVSPSRIRITAVNGGKTRIKAMAGGGASAEKYAYIDVTVDIKSSSMKVKENVALGVVRGKSVELDASKFNFYASTSSNSGKYTTTVNEYDFADNIAGCSIVGSVLTVGKNYSSDTINLVPELNDNDVPQSEITVQVFDAFGKDDSGLNVTQAQDGEDADTPFVDGGVTLARDTNSGLPTVELVKNGAAGANKKKVTFELADSFGDLNADSGTGWGYKISGYDENIVYINDFGRTGNSGGFEAASMGIGETEVIVTVFPIRNGVRYDKDYHSGLQVTQRIRIESRNVFKENALVFVKDGKTVGENHTDSDDGEIDVFFIGGEPVLQNFTLGVLEGGQLSGLTVNNTLENSRNSYVKFSVQIGGDSTNYIDLFNITYRVWPYTGPVVPLMPEEYAAPYDARFSISVKDEDALDTIEGLLDGADPDAKVKFIVTSTGEDNGTGTVTESITLNCVRAVGEITAEFQGEEVDVLYPVADGSNYMGVYFTLVTVDTDSQGVSQGVRSQADYYTPVFDAGAGEIFDIAVDTSSSWNNDPDNVSRFILRVKDGVSPDTDTTYSFRMVYKDGKYKQLGIQFLNKFNKVNLTANISGGTVLQTANEVGVLTAFVRAGGVYSFNINQPDLISGYDFTDGNGNLSAEYLGTLGFEFPGAGLFCPARQGNYDFYITLRTRNDDVFGLSAGSKIRFRIRLGVINPIESAFFDKNRVEVVSAATLGESPVINGVPVYENLERTDSTVEFNLNFVYAYGGGGGNGDIIVKPQMQEAAGSPGVYSDGKITLYTYSDDKTSFKIQGNNATNGVLSVRFNIIQKYEAGDEVLEYKLEEAVVFYITVKDAPVVENIYVTNAGASLGLNTSDSDSGTSIALRTTVYPQNVYNPQVNFGFIEGGNGETIQELQTSISNGDIPFSQIKNRIQDYVSIDPAGVVTAGSTSNIRDGGKSIMLVVYSLDSLDGGDNFPKTYICLPVYIADTDEHIIERVIRNLDDFLQAFYKKKPGVSESTPYIQAAVNGQLVSREDLGNGFYANGEHYQVYYRLANDIDLAPVYAESRYLPAVQYFGRSASAVLIGTKYNSAGEAEGNYSIKNFKVSPDRLYREYHADDYGAVIPSPSTQPNQKEYYGFFDVIGPNGTVDSVSFGTPTEGRVTGQISANNAAVASREQNAGILAGVNKGTIKDVCVYIDDSNPFSISVGQNANANIGGLVGRNDAGDRDASQTSPDRGRGIFESAGRLFVTGTVKAAININSPTFRINFGGIAGINNGVLSGNEDKNLLDADVLVNSELTLALTSAENIPESKYLHGPAYYINAGGLAGENTGAKAVISGLSSECAIYNSTKINGNTGGMVGHNSGGAILSNGFSSSAVYARNAVGGVVGRNTGTAGSDDNTIVERCYYDNYLNERVSNMVLDLLKRYVNGFSREPYYAGLMTDQNSAFNYNQTNGFNQSTAVGGVAGVNESGDLTYCFASSVFENTTETVLGMPYKGDIYVMGELSIAVGGVIGRMESTVNRNAFITACYSTLTVGFDDESANPNDYDMRVGGLAGYITVGGIGTNTFNSCYSDLDMKIRQGRETGGSVSYGGFAGAVASGINNVAFNNCYTRVAGDSFIVNGSTPLNAAPGTANRLVVRSGFVGFTDGTNPNPNPSTGITLANDLYIKDGTTEGDISSWVNGSSRFRCDEDTAAAGYPYPVLRRGESGDDLNKLYLIAAPTGIEVELEGYQDYHNTMAAGKNNRGGYNLVIPNALTVDTYGRVAEEDVSRAAIFLSTGGNTTSNFNEIANRYYLEELLGDVRIDPEIAASRIVYSIETGGTESSDIAEKGVTVGENGPKYYIEVKKLGKFDLVVRSTRQMLNNAGVLTPVEARISFDVVDGNKYIQVVTNAVGTIGKKSLSKDESSFNEEGGSFSVQKGTAFSIGGLVDGNGWSVRIFEQDWAENNTTAPTIDYDNGESVPDNLVKQEGYDVIRNFQFGLVPYIRMSDGAEYWCRALTFEVTCRVFGGAAEVKFDQSAVSGTGNGNSTVDAASGLRYDGVFVTDIGAAQFGWPAGTSAEDKLLDLSEFTFNFTGDSIRPTLFGGSQKDFKGRPYTEISVEGQPVKIIFTLETVLDEDTLYNERTYDIYNFSIYVSLVMDNSLYGNIDIANQDQADKINAADLAEILENLKVKGRITATEKEHQSQRDADVSGVYVPKTGSVDLEIIPQDLQAVEFLHYADAEKISSAKASLALPDDAPQSMNIYTQDELSGLMKVYAIPYFSVIEEFTLGNNPEQIVLQYVGMTNEKNEYNYVFEQWKVWFGQMVQVADKESDEFMPILTDSGDGARFKQVSRAHDLGNGNYRYEWTGVYYIQTKLVEPNEQFIVRGSKDSSLADMEDDVKTFIIERNSNIQPTVKNVDAVDTDRVSMRIDGSAEKFFTINAKFTTGGGRELNRSFNMYPIDKPGVHFEVDGKTVTSTEQAVGTVMDFYVRTVPADKVNVVSKKVTFGTGTSVSIGEGKPASLDDTVAAWCENPDTGHYKIYLPENVDYGSNISIMFTYEHSNSNGAPDQAVTSTLNITPVLFKVRGFNINSGNYIRLTDRYNIDLFSAVQHAGNNSSDDGAPTPSDELLRDIHREVASFNAELNSSQKDGSETEYMKWTANGRTLNAGWGDDMNPEYYTRQWEDSYPLPFYLGKYGPDKATSNQKFLVYASSEVSSATVYVDLAYKYDRYGVPFIVPLTDANSKILTSTFTVEAGERDTGTVIPVFTYNWDEIVSDWRSNAAATVNQVAKNNYILMEDVVLENWAPLNFNAASLDGNNKKITIKGFNLKSPNDSTKSINDIGLFSSVGSDTVIKNVNVVVPKSGISIDLRSHSNTVSNIVRIGMLAATNNGVITNCAVLSERQFLLGDIKGKGPADIYNYSLSTEDTSEVKITIEKSDITVNVGGLVGYNTGDISNSRVMISTKVIGAVGVLTVAGFAADNSGTITSSFFRDGSIINQATLPTGAVGDEANYKTSGFIGTNSGTIRASYVMGYKYSITANGTGCVTEGQISASGGTVTGFVSENSRLIEDCYVNVRITSGPRISGFVGFNTAGDAMGTIRNCLVNNINDKNLNNYYYFIYADVNSPLGNLYNCKYVGGRGWAGNVDVVSSLNYSGLTNITNFRNNEGEGAGIEMGNVFSIAYSEGNGKTVWQMGDYGPELVSANDIAVSEKVIEHVMADNGTLMLPSNEVIAQEWVSYQDIYYGDGRYNSGTKENPIVITNGDEFNKLIYENSGAKQYHNSTDENLDFNSFIFDKHIRLVKDIVLNDLAIDNGTEEAIKDLQTYKTVFSGVIDGNGFAINEVSVSIGTNSSSDEIRIPDSIGLFSKVENAIIKNVDISITGISGNVTYAGGLAGKVINSSLVDINVNRGLNTTGSLIDNTRGVIGGLHIVGGVAGYIELSSDNIVENINSNLSVNVSFRQNMDLEEWYPSYDGADDYLGKTVNLDVDSVAEQVSVAGGLFGIVTGDGTVRDIGHNHIGTFTNSLFGMRGEIIGGLVGVADSSVTLDWVRFNLQETNQLHGTFYIGGLVGANFGMIKDSNVEIQDMTIRSNIIGTNINTEQEDLFVFGSNGMTVGGAVGFNSGTVDGVKASVNMDIGNITKVLISGGIAGENTDGTVKNSEFGRRTVNGVTYSASINGGYYIGGIVGMNSGVTGLEDNTLSDVSWGGNIVANNSDAVVGVGENGLFEKFSRTNVGLNVTPTNNHKRTYFTGAYVGVNYDTSGTTNEVINGWTSPDNSHLIGTSQRSKRNVGLFALGENGKVENVEIQTYKMTLNANGGIVNGATLIDVDVAYGSNDVLDSSTGLPVPTSTGKIFGGWFNTKGNADGTSNTGRLTSNTGLFYGTSSSGTSLYYTNDATDGTAVGTRITTASIKEWRPTADFQVWARWV